MYFDDAKTLAADVLWYFAPAGSKPLPFPTIFTSETWDEVHWHCGGAGEDEASKPGWYNGTMPGPFKGDHFCGDPSWWQFGCPSDAPRIELNAAGLPVCCFGRGAYGEAFSEAWDVFRGR